MENLFKKETFEFSEEELSIFKNFLLSAVPLVLVNWKRFENRPKFPDLPNYRLLGVMEDFEGEDEATTTIHALFESSVKIRGIGTGNDIWIRSFGDVQQICIGKLNSDDLIRYLLLVKHHEHVVNHSKSK